MIYNFNFRDRVYPSSAHFLTRSLSFRKPRPFETCLTEKEKKKRCLLFFPKQVGKTVHLFLFATLFSRGSSTDRCIIFPATFNPFSKGLKITPRRLSSGCVHQLHSHPEAFYSSLIPQLRKDLFEYTQDSPPVFSTEWDLFF